MDRAGYAYAKAIVEDTAWIAPVGYVTDETGDLKDAAAEITAAVNGAVDRMTDDLEEGGQ